MKDLYLNTKVLGNPDTRRMLKKMYMSYMPGFIFLTKPWVSSHQVPSRFWRKIRLKLFASNRKGDLLLNLWYIFQDHLNSTVVFTSHHFQGPSCFTWDFNIVLGGLMNIGEKGYRNKLTPMIFEIGLTVIFSPVFL